MHLTKRHILNIINGNMLTAEQMAEALIAKDAKMDEIKRDVACLERRKDAAVKRYQEELTKIEDQLKTVRAKCDHEWHTNHDPSGGRDHDTRCTICDMEHP